MIKVYHSIYKQSKMADFEVLIKANSGN